MKLVRVSVPYFHVAEFEVPEGTSEEEILKIFHREADTKIEGFDYDQAEIEYL